MFLDDFADYLSLIINTTGNIFVGDFNIHVNDELDQNAALLNDMLQAHRLKQPIMFPTHNKSNKLDKGICPIVMKTKLCPTSPGPYISDHLTMEFNFRMEKDKLK